MTKREHRSSGGWSKTAKVIGELRQALRLQNHSDTSISRLSRAGAIELGNLQYIKRSVEKLEKSLRARIPQRGPAQDKRQAIKIVLAHLERHGPSLWGHPIALPDKVGGGIRLVDHTNLPLEGFFHGVKHDERRRSGRKDLGQDLENLPEGAFLATNLEKPDYVEQLCGTIDQLALAFAELDARDRSLSLPAWQRAVSMRSADIASSSMPKADRATIRSKVLKKRILAAAKSRAPHRAPSRSCAVATLD